MILFVTYLLLAEFCNFIAGIMNAFMDKTETVNQFQNSKFYKLNPLYWSKVEASGAKRLPFTKYPWNAWHNAKSIMIIMDKTSEALMFFAGICCAMTLEWYCWLIVAFLWICSDGSVRIFSFNLFYNRIFKK